MLVPVAALQVDYETLDLASNNGAVGQPQRQAGSAGLIAGEDLELPAEPAVVRTGVVPNGGGPESGVCRSLP